MFMQKERDIWKFYTETPKKIQKDQLMGENGQNIVSHKMVFYLKTAKYMGYLELEMLYLF